MFFGSAYTVLHNYTKALSVAMSYRDPLTRLHSDRVLALAEATGMRCGLPKAELELLKFAAAFHDIGKIGIADSILMKTSKLDDAEWEAMKQHATIGEDILLATGVNGAPQAARIVRHHHEHYDGQGYPDGLAGEDIPVLARIISIADSYDAVAVTRSYHRRHGHAEVMQVLHEETGSKHDPYLMRIFSELIESSPLKAASA
jgi:HD-GYP domain-containing protein (c-di-GMP phosphodiesterase class II)